MVHINKGQYELIHKIELEMLVEIKRICEKYGIKYTIIGGTLLGAVRHGGFIPWDDDADVALLRPEYEKFCKVVQNELDKDRFYFQNMDVTPGYRWGYAKLRRIGTVFLREDQERMPYDQGVFLDIFPIDGTPDNFILKQIHNLRCFAVRKILWSAVGRVSSKSALERQIYKILYLIPEKTVGKMYKGLILRYNSNNTKIVRTLTFPAPKPLCGYYRKWFAETAPIEFEGVMFQGVKDYKGWLSYEFGDYMSLPPENKRKSHPVSELKLIDVERKDNNG